MPHESTFVRRAYDFLMLHGWRPVPSDTLFIQDAAPDFVEADVHDGLWLHKNDRSRQTTSYTTRSAVQIQLINDRVRLLEAEGWEVEFAHSRGSEDGEDGWVDWVHKMRSAIDFKPDRKRIIGTLQLAMRYQREKGWTALSNAPDMPAIWDRHQLVVPVWCPYCEEWHVHAFLGEPFEVGQKLDHRDAGCESKTPYTNVGYRPVVQYVTPPFFSE
jgi:hypothetical protein